MARARNFFEHAMVLDPENVEAMAGLGWVDAAVGVSAMTDDWSTRFETAEEFLTKALFLAPRHALSHVLMGLVQILTKRAVQGVVECERALALDHNLAGAHAIIGYGKILLGRADETEAHINEAIRLSPRDTFSHQWAVWVGLANAQLNRETEALNWLRRGLEANRNYSIAYFYVAAALGWRGELDRARAVVQAGLALNPTFTTARWSASIKARSENPTYITSCERFIEGMRLAGVPEG